MDRLDISELANAVLLDLGKEVAGSPVIGQTDVFVADGGGEELQEPARGVFAGIRDYGRHGKFAAQRRCLDRRRGLDEADRRRAASAQPVQARHLAFKTAAT
jgi:hypothetical protein